MDKRATCSLHCLVLPWLMSLAAFGVTVLAQSAAVGVEPLKVNVDPGKTRDTNVGCGFNHLGDSVYELKIELESQYEIVDARIEEQADDGVVWDWERDEEDKIIDIRKFHVAGVDPNKHFWVVIWAKLAPPGEGEGITEGWMSVSDLDADADTDNNSAVCPRIPSQSDAEDFAEYPGYQSPPTVPGLVVGVNDDHDEFPSDDGSWGYDRDNVTAVLNEGNEFKDGTSYGGWSVGLAQIKVQVCVKRAPGDLKFTIPSTIRLFEGEDGKKGKEFEGDRSKANGTAIATEGDHPFVFYMEGKQPYQEPQQLVISYDPEGPGQGKAEDIVTVLPVQMDLDVDSDNDGEITSDDDLIEAKPDEIGMIVPVTANPEHGKRGKLRVLLSQNVAYLLHDLNPVIKLGQIPGAGGDVCVWRVPKVAPGDPPQPPILVLNTAIKPSTTTDDEGNTLFQLLGDATDHDILITGVAPGEVMLGLQLTVNGVKVAMDVVRVVTGVDLDVNVDDHPQDANGIPLASRKVDITDDDDVLEDSRGGYLWVNDDNDRQVSGDTTLDIDDTNLPTADNDLEPMQIRVPYWKGGTTLVFQVGLQLRTRIRIWHEPTKNTLLALDASGQAVITAPDAYDVDNDGYYWIEGLGACSADRITVTFHANATHSMTDTVLLTVYEVTQVQILPNQGLCHAGHSGVPVPDFATDPTGQTRTGVRIFPDAAYPGDTSQHNVFMVSATLIPSIPPDSGWHVPVCVKAFDVDHYSSDTAFDDASSSRATEGHSPGREPNDNRTGYGAAADDPSDPPQFGVAGDAPDIGIRIHSSPMATVQHVLADNATEVRWADRVGAEHGSGGLSRTSSFMEITEATPGNNWRFAAGCGNTLHNAVRINNDPTDGETLEVVTGPNGQPLTTSGGSTGLPKSTETLTVWRRLWIERDYMGPVDLLEGTADVRSAQEGDVTGGQGTVTASTTLDFGQENQFQGGVAMFWDMDWFWGNTFLAHRFIESHQDGTDEPITVNEPVPTASDYVYVADDDVVNVDLHNGASPRITPATADLTLFNDPDGFPAACIEAIPHGTYDNVADFQLYVDTSSPAVECAIAAANRGLPGGVNQWVAQVIECFQPRVARSYDPNLAATRGSSCPYWHSSTVPGANGGTFVFIETVRDYAENAGVAGDFTELRRRRVTLHEVGHVLGGRHPDGDIMQAGTGTDPASGMFSGKSLRRFMLLRDAGP